MLRATAAFHAVVDGVERMVAADEFVSETDPVVAGREGLFETADPAKPAQKKTTSRRS
jgi:hypothetical protein